MSIPWKQRYNQRKANGVCVRCGAPRDRDGVYCEICTGKMRQHQQKRYHRLGNSNATLMKFFSFIVRGGKIQPKEAK